MKHLWFAAAPIAITFTALASALPPASAGAVNGPVNGGADGSGRLGTLPLGNYVCSQPGDAGGAAWVVLPGLAFTIGNGSTYHTEKGSGVYLLAGDQVTFTGGPMKGLRFKRASRLTLLMLNQEGQAGRVRCAMQISKR